MGVDITMHIVKNGEFIKNDIFDGRNYEWFDNISGRNITDVSYEHYPANHGVIRDASVIPNEWIDLYDYCEENYYYGFRYISVKDFRDWYIKYSPHIQAGWVTKYVKFLMDYKGYQPELGVDLFHYLSEGDIIEDMVWVTYENTYDCSKWLYRYLGENCIDNDAYIVYCFDC